ncbi:MAG: hypothetical protein ACK5BE_02695 [Alphaproteobacteria bacterium]|jgi:hypothetical protein
MKVDIFFDLFLLLVSLSMIGVSFIAYFRTRWFLANARRTQAIITRIEKDEKQEETNYTLEFKDQLGKEWKVRTQSGIVANTLAKKFNRERKDAFIRQNRHGVKGSGYVAIKEKIDTLFNQEFMGEKIHIFYQQDNPEKIRVDNFGALWLSALLEGAVGLMLIGYLASQHWTKVIGFFQ